MAATRVYFEQGAKSVFAVALDWPGWARRAGTSDLALDALEAYRARYQRIVGGAQIGEAFEIIGTVPGSATTDYGAPSESGPWDDVPLTAPERTRQVGILTTSWGYFDDIVAHAPAELRKGPRGGGRDRDKMVNHVREAERAYSSKIGTKIPVRTPWTEQREAIVATLQSGESTGGWTTRYAIRRIAWHVVDHAWEIEDKRS
jgi:hypothetical protein